MHRLTGLLARSSTDPRLSFLRPLLPMHVQAPVAKLVQTLVMGNWKRQRDMMQARVLPALISSIEGNMDNSDIAVHCAAAIVSLAFEPPSADTPPAPAPTSEDGYEEGPAHKASSKGKGKEREQRSQGACASSGSSTVNGTGRDRQWIIKRVLASGALPHLMQVLERYKDDKVRDPGART